jgi:hypothetical protein
MKIVIITSCTGEKSVESADGLTLADFQRGPAHVAAREDGVRDLLRSAEDIYTGQQHVRLMRGITAFREAYPSTDATWTLDLHVLSAGYGLVEGARLLAPYEATFQGMKTKELRSWADALGVPAAIRRVLAQPYDLAVLLLGDGYLSACNLDASVKLGGRTIAFCGGRMAEKLPAIDNLLLVPLENADAKRFGSGLVALKGELVRRMLIHPGFALNTVPQDAFGLLAWLDGAQIQKTVRGPARANATVDRAIEIPSSWHAKPHRGQLRYFIPEWDDLVDRDFDFQNDVHSGGRGNWSNEVYAHQMYPEPNYDGILISKVVAEAKKDKRARINALGVHRFLRVPRSFPIMGDCGAFGYIAEKVPPYTTPEILDYYTRLDFDYGVSIDHLIVASTESEKRERYELTIANAEEFLIEHRKAGHTWTPIGAVQGWDPRSYADASRKYVAMGYKYIALGGLVRSPTPQILDVMREVHRVVPVGVDIHLFGLARLNAMSAFADMGVRSVDSASYLRRAWMGSGGQNYLTMEGEFYTAIRVPEAGKSYRAKRMVSEARASADTVLRLEQASLKALRDFDRGQRRLSEVVDILVDYDQLITPDRVPHRHLLERTLEARPWKKCGCEICKKDGIDVLIFRGNNRNRRRGFHNTYVFYRLLQRALSGEHLALASSPAGKKSRQISLLPDLDEQDAL